MSLFEASSKLPEIGQFSWAATLKAREKSPKIAHVAGHGSTANVRKNEQTS
jgi:hypothetical protein